MAVTRVHPLVLADAGKGSVEVRDDAGRIYFSARAGHRVSFTAGGALGRQEVRIRDPSGNDLTRLYFDRDAET